MYVIYSLLCFSYTMYCATRLVCGLAMAGTSVTGPTLMYELVSTDRRALASAIFSIGWAVGRYYNVILCLPNAYPKGYFLEPILRMCSNMCLCHDLYALFARKSKMVAYDW